MTKKRQVLLIRHGQTDWNASHRWQGHEPTHLNKQGHAEARRLADHLKDFPIDAVYSSDLPRAYETAKPLVVQHSLTLVKDERLREIDVGIFQGLTSDVMKIRYPTEYDRWQGSDDDYAPPNGESRNQLKARAAAAFDDITAKSFGSIAIVTHGGTIRLLLQHLYPNRADLKGRMPVPNTSFTIMEQEMDNTWCLLELTAAPHLADGNNRTDGYGT
jgi:probable phosphoglycerate mutase